MSAWMEMATGGHYNATSNQAWRDNFNGGWAAGDITGNINAQIASDRADAGERNPDVLAYLPDGYKLNPNPTGPGSGQSVSVGQGASPSQSGSAKGPTVREEPAVKQAAARFAAASDLGFGLIASHAGPWVDKVRSDYRNILAGGDGRQSWAEKPLGHEQMYIGGHKIVHDTGWSTGEVPETIYGEGGGIIPGPTDFYQWAKFTADMSKTLEANGYPRLDQVGDWILRAPNDIGQSINRAGVDWLQENVPSSTSAPGARNPYGGSSPWSAPF